MQATRQQQIVGYFIEEAKEHLDTIEQGLLDLQNTMADSERRNELFRAAHSVKGGAAMLGLHSIQRISHALEDCFKTLKDQPVKVDQQLENLFLIGFDTLKSLLQELESPYGLQPEKAERLVKAAGPTFVELQNYLRQKVQASHCSPQQPVVTAQLAAELGSQLNNTLKLMLRLFKQGDTLSTRQQLAVLCQNMAQFSSNINWQNLLQNAENAIADAKNSYSILAPVIIKELKQAGDLVVAGKANEIAPSRELLQLVLIARTINSAFPPITSISTSVDTPTWVSVDLSGGLVREPAFLKPQPLMIPSEPRAAARALLNAFDRKQLIELAEFLMKAIQ